jgi:DNA polymerase
VSEVEPHEELAQLASGLRALLEQLEGSGATEVPSSGVDLQALASSWGRGREGPTRPVARVEPRHEPARPESARHEPARHEPFRTEPARTEPRRIEPRAEAREPEPRPVESARPAAGLDRDAARVRLAQIEQVVASCTRCALHESRTKTVFARGDAAAELMFVGEGPGEGEDAQGVPFVGKAGQLLDKMIEAMGYRPEQVYIGNVVKCRPPNNRKPEPQEAAACQGYLHEQIALVRPKVIVALGATAVEGLLGISGITRLRGTWRLYRGAIPVMPTFHPAYLLRTPEAKREVWSDLKQVMAKLGRPVPAR